MFAHLPNWTKTDNFLIDARGPEDSTRDQMRLMVQSVLADRFNLKVHFEQPETPVLVMTLAQPGKPGPNLHLHSQGPPCDKVAPTNASGDVQSVWPSTCDRYALKFDGQHPAIVGSRNTTLDMIA